MPLSALLLALAAAFVHALWNLLLARARDPEAATAVALIVAVVVFAPVSVFVWGLEREVWPYLVVTSCLQLLYFSLLITAYRKAEVSVVYPVARGVAPTLVLLAGIVVLGYSTSWAQAAGVVLVGWGCSRSEGSVETPVRPESSSAS
jgi:multidrug transporter EmrE-like cation transporter